MPTQHHYVTIKAYHQELQIGSTLLKQVKVRAAKLPYGMSFQEALNWHREFSQETLDNRSALCKFVFNFYFQDIRGQGDKAELLQ